MTLFFWSKNLDPEYVVALYSPSNRSLPLTCAFTPRCCTRRSSYTLPVHSSLIDLLGQIFLVIAFEVAARMGADVINVDGVK